MFTDVGSGNFPEKWRHQDYALQDTGRRAEDEWRIEYDWECVNVCVTAFLDIHGKQLSTIITMMAESYCNSKHNNSIHASQRLAPHTKTPSPPHTTLNPNSQHKMGTVDLKQAFSKIFKKTTPSSSSSPPSNTKPTKSATSPSEKSIKANPTQHVQLSRMKKPKNWDGEIENVGPGADRSKNRVCDKVPIMGPGMVPALRGVWGVWREVGGRREEERANVGAVMIRMLRLDLRNFC